ncbi:MAG: SDR family NAD(P)-dependent oxidoreductase [Elsteraceae bacterium]
MVWATPFEEFRGKVVLVTGASTGIGAAVAKGFGACGARVIAHANASREAGAAVVAEIVAAGGEARLVQADLSSAKAARKLIEEVLAAEGRIDVLINNAGTIVGRKRLTEVDDAFADYVMDLNFTSLYAAIRAVVPAMRRQGGGVIVNTTSIAARMGGGPGTVSYGAAKGAVASLTRGVARELAVDHIRVNAVAPGLIDTPLHDKLTPPEVIEGMLPSVPMRRMGSPEECVGTYLFLASDRLSGYITGQIVEISGGMV